MCTTAWFNLDAIAGKPAGRMIRYDLCADALVTLEIYDMLGKRIRTLVQGKVQHPGHYDVFWDSCNGAGRTMHPGCYLYELHADSVGNQPGR